MGLNYIHPFMPYYWTEMELEKMMDFVDCLIFKEISSQISISEWNEEMHLSCL